MYLGSAIKDLQEVINDPTNINGNHSLKIFLSFLFI